MSNDFEALLEQSFAQCEMRAGALVKATVLAVDSDVVTVNANLKSDSAIASEEFRDPRGRLEIEVGEEVDVIIEMVENGFGETILSREKAKRAASWLALEQAFEKGEPVDGLIVERVKGGFTVDLQAVKAFLPGSLVDVRPMRDQSELEGQVCRFAGNRRG